MTPGYKVPPLMLADEKEHRRQIVEALQGVMRGKINSVISLTLNPSATTTAIVDKRIGANTHITLSPKTANAAAAQTAIWVSSQTNGQATLTHASSANTDQTYAVLLIG